MSRQFFSLATGAALVGALVSTVAFGSSHREAPFITELPKVDGTDFYMFRSYEQNREGFVTLIANYQPLQDAYGGPNYFTMDPNALYEIHIDNDGNSREDLTFQFRFQTTYRNATIDVDGREVGIPLANIGPDGNASTVGPNVEDTAGLNVIENYSMTLVRGDRRTGTFQEITNPTPLDGDSTSSLFRKPVDNIGNKTIPNYSAYANNHIFEFSVPGCSAANADSARVFVGQRREGFVINLGEVFDRINNNGDNAPVTPGYARDADSNILDDKNITSLALEIPTACLTEEVTGDETAEPVIGGWTTASLRQARVLNPIPLAPGQPLNDADDTAVAQDGEISTPAVSGGPWTQVSRLGSPLVNEVVIGLNAKDQFNANEPQSDLSLFGAFVTNPTLPVLINALFNVPAPATPRNDLVAAFITGIRTPVNGEPTNFTQPQFVTDTNVDLDDDGVVESIELRTGGEMLRLNTAFPPGPAPALAEQNNLGFLACDLFGFPNGRRPFDDVVDIELTVLEGAIRGDDPGTDTVDESNPNNLQTCDVSGETPTPVDGAVVHDGALPERDDYLDSFPYLNTPLPGSPIDASQPAP